MLIFSTIFPEKHPFSMFFLCFSYGFHIQHRHFLRKKSTSSYIRREAVPQQPPRHAFRKVGVARLAACLSGEDQVSYEAI
jgi:hypothetical protein